MAVTVATRMIAETFMPIRGWVTDAALQTLIAPNPTSLAAIGGTRFPRGCIGYKDPTTGTFIAGLGNLAVVPLFAFYPNDDPSVTLTGGGDPSADVGAFVSANLTGEFLCFVGTAALECVSTNYDVTGTYAPQDPLTSPLTGANRGKAVVGTLHTNMIFGFVSRGVVSNGYGQYSGLSFYTCPVYP